MLEPRADDVASEHVVHYPYDFEKADEPSRFLCLFRTYS